MRFLLLLLLAIVFLNGYAEDANKEQCCKAKSNNGVIYLLVEEEENTTFKECTSACVYERFDQPGSRFCFTQGGLATSCVKIPPTQGDSNNDVNLRNSEYFTIGGLTEKDFQQLTTREKITFFKGLYKLNLKRLVLNKFCGGIQNCFYLIRRGTTDTQRLSLLSNNPEDRDLYYGEICDKECEYLQQEFWAKRNMTISGFSKSSNEGVYPEYEYNEGFYPEYSRQAQGQAQENNQFQVEEVEKDKTFLGGTKQNFVDASTALNGMNKFKNDLTNANGDGMKVLSAFIDLGETVFPLTGPVGAAFAMLAGPLKIIFGLGVTPNGFIKLEKMLKDLTKKVEEEHKRTRRNIEFKIDIQTKQLQAGFKSLESSFSDNTKLIERRIIAQTELLIKEIKDTKKELKVIIENAIVAFTSSSRDQTNQIVSEVQLQNREQLRTLSKLYSKADQDAQSFFDAFDELNGIRNKLVLMDVFLNINVDDHIYEDLSTIMNQFSTFEGAKTFGATRSWMSRFCGLQENTYLCLDLLALYVSLAVLRDQVFYRLAATIKKSDHGDADVLTNQILGTTQYRQRVDGDFLAEMVLKNRDKGGCILSCLTRILDQPLDALTPTNENIEKNMQGDSLTFNFPGTVLEETKEFRKDTGSLICSYMRSSTGLRCNYDMAVCSKCFENIECNEGFYPEYDMSSKSDKCAPCECNLAGTIQLSDQPRQACNNDGTCFCNSFYEGKKCDKCKDTNAADCFKGTCPDNFYSDPQTTKCVECNCDTGNTITGSFCDKSTGQCQCRLGYSERKCDECAAGYNDQYISPATGNIITGVCKKCICSSLLALQGNQCGLDGKCKCKVDVDNADGKCTDCLPGYYETKNNECVACDCDKYGAEDRNCDDTGRCTCKIEYNQNDKKCETCNTDIAFLNNVAYVPGRCQLCGCHEPGSDGRSCLLNAGKIECKCKGDYTNTPGYKRCHFKKGIDSLGLKFGDDPGGLGIKFQICTSQDDSDCCETDQLDLDQKEGWHHFKDGLDNCKSKPLIVCGRTLRVKKIEVGVGFTGFVNDVTIDAIEIKVGVATYSLDESGIWEWGEEQEWNKNLICIKNCPPVCSLKSLKRGAQDNNTNVCPWTFPPPHEVIRPSSKNTEENEC